MRFMFMLPVSVLFACAGNEPVGTITAPLTVDQCSYFAQDGQVTICHATSSAKNPYVIITVAEEGCIDGHEGHDGDKISHDGATCKDACFAPGEPVDESNKEFCCTGAAAIGGFCPACEPIECHEVKFDLDKGCVYFPMNPGTPCSDEDECTKDDRCNDKLECVGVQGDPRCGCSADAQAAGDAAYYACLNGKVQTDCFAAGFDAFKKAYAESYCGEQPNEWKQP